MAATSRRTANGTVTIPKLNSESSESPETITTSPQTVHTFLFHIP